MRPLSLLPFLVFFSVFIGLNIYYPLAEANIKSDFAIFSVFIALITSFFIFKKNTSINERIEVFIKGAAQETIIHMCFVFLFSTMLSYALERTGGSESAVEIALYLIPHNFILPGIFIATSLVSTCLGTSMGAIVTFMPIFYKLSQELFIDTPLVAGIVVGGAIFGDNLSLISDTTIAAVKVTGSNMYEKVKDNIIIAFPAALITLVILTYLNNSYIIIKPPIFLPAISILNFLKIMPYILTFILAFIGFDILFELVVGIILAIGIGIYFEKITLLDTLTLFNHGFYESKGIVSIFILVLLLSGLSQIVQHNGGIEYLLNLLGKEKKSQAKTKLEILALIMLVNTAIAINTISILLTGPIAAKIAHKKISPARVANILDIGACITQGILPYTPQMLLAATICKISPLSILSYLIYPYLLFITLIINLFFLPQRKNFATH